MTTPDRPECSGDPAREGRSPDCSRAKSAPDAMRRLLTSAKLLQANSVGCAVKHHGFDIEQHGLPDWLLDTKADIEAADAILSAPAVGVTREAIEFLISTRANAYSQQGGKLFGGFTVADDFHGLVEDIRALSSVPDATVSGEPDALADLVARFSRALLAKLRLASASGRSGWERDDWKKHCQQGLLRHLEKGDPRDVAAYCAFMWHHGWITTPQDVGREATIEECARLVESTGLNNKSNIARDIRALSRNGGGRG